jgi:hypothetical protein
VATSAQCRTITLTDEPEENDAFSGPHQRIADALVGLIQPADAKGISIGIEGSWGSGKSTVARLLTGKLKGDENIATVSFDAWAHEGDPLRRTFLETIIRTLQERKWIKKDDWDERIEELANRREVVKTKDSLSITRWGRVIAFTLLLIPIGSAFITAALRENVTLYRGPVAWKFLIFFLIGLLLTFTPLLVLLLKIKEEPDLLSLLFNKGPTEKTTITSKTVNPTSIEFEEKFNAVLEEALGNNQKRIVLILDNLDRVDAKDALSIWSTLQTFFQHKGMKPGSWHERLWLLVLYDLGGLSQLWADSGKPGGNTAASFIDKSFQVRFEVPALVSSDWRRFLMDQLAKALPDHSEFDLHEVYRVLATHVAMLNQRLTIRELKLFVNQIGVIHKQWAAGGDRASDEFSLALIAYYVLLRRTGTNVVNAIFNAEFPGKAYEELLGEKARENVAAIAFNVEVDVARQLLFSDKIKHALTLGSGEELKKVASLVRRGFWEVFEQTAKEWASGETVKVAEAALALEESGLMSNAFQPSVRTVTRALCDRASAIESWAPLDHRRAEGIAVILKWKNNLQGSTDHDEAFASGIFKAIAEGLKDHAKEIDEGEVVKEWLECLDLITAGLASTAKESGLATVVGTITDQFKLSDVDLHKQLYLEALIELESVVEANMMAHEMLAYLTDVGIIQDYLFAPLPKSDRSVAFMIYTLMRYTLRFTGIARLDGEQNFNSLINASMAGSLVELLERRKEVSLLFESLKASPQIEPLVVAALKPILASADAKELFTGPEALERLEFVFRNLPKNPDDQATLTKLMSELKTQRDILSELRVGTFKADNAALYLLALRESSGEQKDFVSWCVAGLRSVSFDTWTYEFHTGGALFSLAFELESRGTEVHLGEKYHSFLTSVIGSSSETEVPEFPSQNLVTLAGPVGSASRTLSQRDLEARLRDRSTTLPKSFFSVFGPELTTMVLNSESDKSIELLEIIFKRTDPVALEWLKELVAQNASTLESKHSSEPGWIQFRHAVRQALLYRASNMPLYPSVKGIADNFNIKPPRNGGIAFAVYDEARISLLEREGVETRDLLDFSSAIDVLVEPTWAPDGKKLAYTRISRTRLGHSEIEVLDVASGRITSITDSDQSSSQPAWSPNCRSLAFVRGNITDNDIYTIDLLTREEQRLTDDGGNKGHPSWSPDGTRLVFHRSDSASEEVIFIMTADGTYKRSIFKATGVFDPSWSPDGNHITFASWDDNKEKSGIYVMNLDGSNVRLLTMAEQPQSPAWSPDGQKLLFQSGNKKEAIIYQVDADGKNRKRLTNGIDPTWQPLIEDGPEETTTAPTERYIFSHKKAQNVQD